MFDVLLEFFLLTIVFAFLAVILLFFKEQKRASFLYSFGIFIIFYTPVLYYFLGGESYSSFHQDALVDFIYYGFITIIIYGVLYVVINSMHFKSHEIFYRDNIIVKLYFMIVVGFVIAYYAMYAKEMPLLTFLLTGEMIDRPDTVGYLPIYFTVSSIAMVMLPATYFYYFDTIRSRWKHIIINLIIAFIFVSSGHKGLIVYYAIFMWLYVMDAKINFKLILIFFGLLGIYMISKGITELNNETLSYMLESPFRRFFVTQGVGFIHRIDMVDMSYIFDSPKGIKADVFAVLYNTDLPGTAPTFFTGDIYVKYGYFASLLFFTTISTVILLISKIVHIAKINRAKFLYWHIYIAIYLIVMSGIEFSNLMRFTIITTNLFIVYIAGKIVLWKV